MQPGKQSGIRRVTSWQLVGAQLRHFRKLAGLTQAALAEQAGVGEDTIASIEQGRRALQLDLAVQLDEVLDTKGVLRVAVERIPRKERYQALVKDFVQYEQDAVSLFSYQSQLIPGLLQTEAYARLVFSSHYPPLEEEEIEKRVTTRLDRQRSWSASPSHPSLHPGGEHPARRVGRPRGHAQAAPPPATLHGPALRQHPDHAAEDAEAREG